MSDEIPSDLRGLSLEESAAALTIGLGLVVKQAEAAAAMKARLSALTGATWHDHGAMGNHSHWQRADGSLGRIDEIGCVAIADVDRWLRDILPHAVAAMRGGHVETEVLDDPLRGPTLAITVITGGWSGVESIIYAVIDHPIMRLRLVEQRRGGVYVFHVPADDDIARERAEVG